MRYLLTVPKYNNMHTAAQRKIAALRRAAGATERQIFLTINIFRERNYIKGDV